MFGEFNYRIFSLRLQFFAFQNLSLSSSSASPPLSFGFKRYDPQAAYRPVSQDFGSVATPWLVLSAYCVCTVDLDLAMRTITRSVMYKCINEFSSLTRT